ncbi:hypothetical protein V5799_005264, partial [Amblyomma americanum]
MEDRKNTYEVKPEDNEDKAGVKNIVNMELCGLRLGNKVIEGKTKIVYELPDQPGNVVLVSKDRITAGDGARAHDLQGKAAISNATAASIFTLLNNA